MSSQVQHSAEMTTTSHRKLNAIQLGLYSLILPNVWVFAAQNLVIGIYAGGMPPLLYGTLIWGFVLSLQCLSFAEYASMWPSSSGCTLIATKLGGARYGRQCGFATGYMHFFAGLVTPAALLSSITPVAASIGSIITKGYEPSTWHIFLIYQAFNAICSTFCVRSSKWLDRVATIGGIYLFVLFFASIGLILDGTNGFTPNRAVWVDLTNVTGWDTGFAVFIGASLPLAGFGPIHWMLNMADQTRNPRKAIPITLLVQQIGNIAMLFAFFLAIGYGLGGQWEAIIDSHISTPIGAIYTLSLPTNASAAAIMLVLVILNASSLASYMNATTRLMHGFAITGAIPFSGWLSRYDSHLNGPTNIMYLIVGMNTVLGTLIFTTSAVVNTLVGAAMTLYFIGYLPGFVAHLLTGGQNLQGKRYFRLPEKLGMALAGLNAVFVLVQAVAFSVPPTYPVTAKNMNWAPFVTGVCILTVYPSWLLYGKSRYNLDEEIIGTSIEGTCVEEVAIEVVGGTNIDKAAKS